jgi:hypothetical protein
MRVEGGVYGEFDTTKAEKLDRFCEKSFGKPSRPQFIVIYDLKISIHPNQCLTSQEIYEGE